MSQTAIRSVGVLGCGIMGAGIARVAAAAGLPTTIVKVTPGTPDAARSKLEQALARELAKGKLTEEAHKRILANLTWTTHAEDLRDSDLVIESVVEDVVKKQEFFEDLDQLCKPETILASNTSTLCITELAAATRRADRFLGLHFFNPVPMMKLVEVVPTLATDERVVAAAEGFARALGKTPIVVRDATGFVVNRLLTPYLLDAIRSLESGLAQVQDIDQSMQLGCGHPMGPFALCDFIGLDIVFAMAQNLFQEFREPRFAPPPLLRRMVAAGMLGKKRQKGFYDYTAEPIRPNQALDGRRPAVAVEGPGRPALKTV
jgi:3-hydroxybutyryl-CoA dehydrogenase